MQVGCLIAPSLQKLASNADYSGQTTPVTMGEGPETYTVRIMRSPTAMPDGQTLPEGTIYAWSTGQSNQSVVQVGALVKVGTSGSKGLPGAFGASVTMSNDSSVDSYDSRKGGYKVVNKNATLMTNSESPGSVYLKNSATVLGSIVVGPKGLLQPGDNDKKNKDGKTSGSSATIWFDNDASFLTSSLQTTPKEIPAVVLPSKPGPSDVTIDGKVTELPPGNYNEVKVSKGVQLSLQPGIYVIRKLDLSNDLAENAKYEQSNDTKLTGIVYGPGASIKLSNSATVYGSVVGSSVTLSNSASIHYDEALADYPLGGGSSSGSVSGVTVLFRRPDRPVIPNRCYSASAGSAYQSSILGAELSGT